MLWEFHALSIWKDDNIRNASVVLSGLQKIPYHLDKYSMVMYRVLCSVCSQTMHVECQEFVKSSDLPGISQCKWYRCRCKVQRVFQLAIIS